MRLFAFERRALVVIFDTILPSGAHPKLPMGARDIPILRFFDDAERDAPFDFMIGLRAALWVIWFCPLLAIGRLRTFKRLTGDDRIRVLRWLQRRPTYFFREIPTIVKTVACLAYCGLPQIQAKIGIERRDATVPAWAEGASIEALPAAALPKARSQSLSPADGDRAE